MFELEAARRHHIEHADAFRRDLVAVLRHVARPHLVNRMADMSASYNGGRSYRAYTFAVKRSTIPGSSRSTLKTRPRQPTPALVRQAT